MVSFLGPLLSFGSSLLSGFGAQQSAKKQQKLQMAYEAANLQLRQTVANEMLTKYDFKNIPTDAMAAGFNPVTWINALGPSYGSLLSTGYTIKSQGQAAPTAQVPSGLEVFGGALSAGVNTFLSDQRTLQSQDFQRELVDRQLAGQLKIAQSRGQTLSFFGSGNSPYRVSQGPAVVGDRIARAPQTDTPLGLSEFKSDDVKVTNPYVSQDPVAPVANAEAWTNRYGESEAVEMAVAGKVLLDDASWWLNRRTFETGFRQNWRELFGYPVYPDQARGLSHPRQPDTKWTDYLPEYPYPFRVPLNKGPLNPLSGWQGMGGF